MLLTLLYVPALETSIRGAEMSWLRGKLPGWCRLSAKLILMAAVASFTGSFEAADKKVDGNIALAASNSGHLVRSYCDPVDRGRGEECPPCHEMQGYGLSPLRTFVAAILLAFGAFWIGWFSRVNKAAVRTAVAVAMGHRITEATLHEATLCATLLGKAAAQVDTILKNRIG